MKEPVPVKPVNRFYILFAGVILMASLGSVYAWSFFTIPLIEAYSWSNMQISIVFSLAVAGLGFGAAFTGPYVSKLGSRRLMRRSAILFVGGYLVAALGLYLGSGVIGPIETPWISWLSYIVLALGYGVIGGLGLGTGYVTSVTTVAGWFPDKKGFASGSIVMGFGLGALFMSKIFAPISMDVTGGNIAMSFLIIAGIYAIIMFFALRYIYSPDGKKAKNYVPTVGESCEHGISVKIKLWAVCFFYSMAGLGIISLVSPIMQDVVGASNPGMSSTDLAAAGATLIAMASIGNSVGRLFWAWLSDIVGRISTFVILLVASAIAYIILPYITTPILFIILITIAVASYGGAFGTIPSLISDLFGPKRMSAIHGLVLTGWATAGLTAPTIFGYMYDVIPENAAKYAFYICAFVLIISSLLVLSLKKTHKECIQPK